jgi:hypothetical protein
MPFLLLIAGLILLLAGSGWFVGAATVGVILIVVSVVVFILQALAVKAVRNAQKKMLADFTAKSGLFDREASPRRASRGGHFL